MIDRNELQNKALKEHQQGVQSAQSGNVQSTQVSKTTKSGSEPAGAPNVQNVQLPKLQATQVTTPIDDSDVQQAQSQSTQVVQESTPNISNISSTLDTSVNSNVPQIDASNTPDSPHIHAQSRTVRAPRESSLETQTNVPVSSNESSDISTNGTDSIQDNINQLQSKLYTNKKKRVLTWIMWGSFALIWIIFLGLGFTVYKTHSMSVLNKTWLPVIVAEVVTITTLIVSKGMLHHQVKLVRKIKELLVLQSLPN